MKGRGKWSGAWWNWWIQRVWYHRNTRCGRWTKRYRDELVAEVNADREVHGKKPFDDEDEPLKPTGEKRDNTSKKKLARRKKAGLKTVAKSATDPDCGMFVKGKHQRQFAYEAHTACDKNGVEVCL